MTNETGTSHLARRLAIGVLVVLGITLFDARLIEGGQVNLPEFWTIIAGELAVAAVGVIVWVVKPDVYDRVLGRRSRIGRTEADRKRAQDDLKVHYQNLIQRMEQWSYLKSDYSDEMICIATENLGLRRSGTPSNLENDKMHLRKFEKTYSLYLDGKKLSKEYKEKHAKTERLLKTSLRKLLEEKGMTIDETEQIKLMWWLEIAIGGELRDVRMVPVPDDTPPELFEIRDILKQRQDLRKSIYDELVVQGKIKDNERTFLSSLRQEVIEPSKESNYSLPQLSNGVCDDCKHLKATPA